MYRYTKILLTGIAGGGVGICLDRFYLTEIKNESKIEFELGKGQNSSSTISIFKVCSPSENKNTIIIMFDDKLRGL